MNDNENEIHNIEDQDAKEFMGSDFLTWLLAESEIREGSFTVSPVGDFTLFFDNKIVLGLDEEVSTFKGEVLNIQEAKFALKNGKKVKEARLRIDVDESICYLTINAEKLQFKSMKIPKTLSTEDEQVFYDRADAFATFINIMDALFYRFLELRISSDWEREMKKVGAWLREIDEE